MRIRSKRLAIALGPIAAAAVAVTALVVTPWASASHVTPTVVSGNPSCETVAPGGGLTELKVDPVASGTYSDGTLTVTVAVAGKSFDWNANRLVQFVIVKGGPSGANVYDYGAGETADNGLKAPGNGGLSHISFCYNPGDTPPPTTTTTTDPKDPPTSTTTTTSGPPEPPATRCTGFAYDLRLDLAGIIGGFVGGPVTSTDKDVFPDRETQSNLNVVFPLTGSTEPIVTATTLDTQNSVDDQGRCVTRVTYEDLRVDLNNISPDQGIPVVLTAKALETITTAQLMGDGTVETTSKFVLVGGSISINGQGGAQEGEIPPNTGYTNEPECFANPNGEGKLCVTIMFHETSIIPNGIAANGVRIKVGLETPLPPTSSQLVDLKLAHAEADAHPA